MADKQVNALTTIPVVASGDILPIFDISEAGSEKLKKVTTSDLYDFLLTLLTPGDVTVNTIDETVGSTGSISGITWTQVQSSVVQSQAGGVFKVQAGALFNGSGSGDVRMRLTVGGTSVAETGAIEFNTTVSGKHDGGATLFYAFTTTPSTNYTMSLDVITIGAGESATFNHRYIATTEYVG